MANALAVRVVSALALTLGLAGCTDGPVADPANGRLTDGSTMTAAAVRTDHEPLAKRFPKLGTFADAHWQGSLVGSTDVPGPSDVLIQGVVVLQPEDLAAAKTTYKWQAAPAGWDAKVNEELRPFVPASGDWQYSPQFELDVRTTRYSGTVYLDMASGAVFLDVNSS
jgi:hypothetical protein